MRAPARTGGKVGVVLFYEVAGARAVVAGTEIVGTEMYSRVTEWDECARQTQLSSLEVSAFIQTPRD
jgi:hypothetical protein